MSVVDVALRRLPHGAGLPLPAYATPDSAGLDLLAAVESGVGGAPPPPPPQNPPKSKTHPPPPPRPRPPPAPAGRGREAGRRASAGRARPRGAPRLIPTGIAIALPPGHEAQVRPRSGLALKHGVTVLNSPGTIDADYRGEVGVILINLGPSAFAIARGDRIAQLVVAPVTRIAWREAGDLADSARGAGGFGSTGIAAG